MLALTFLFWFAIATILLGLVVYASLVGIQNLAKKDKLFTLIPRPGTFSFVVAGENKVVRILENVTGWETNEKQLFVLRGSRKNNDAYSWYEYWLARILGAIWIGPFRSIKKLNKWKWSEFQQLLDKDKKLKYEVILRDVKEEKDGVVTNFFFQFQYPVVLTKVELDGNLEASGLIVFTVHHLNPTRVVFLNKDPVDIFTAMSSSAVRAWMSNKEFDTIKRVTISSKDKLDQEDPNESDEEKKVREVVKDFWRMLTDLNGLEFKSDVNQEHKDRYPDIPDGQPLYDTEKPRGLYGKLGMAIVRAEFVQFDAEGEAAAAIEAKKIADLKGQADITKAEKDAQAKVAKAQGDADALNIEREARAQWVKETIVVPTGGAGAHVADVLIAEQIAGSQVTTYVAGNKSKNPKAMIAVPPSSGKGKKSDG